MRTESLADHKPLGTASINMVVNIYSLEYTRERSSPNHTAILGSTTTDSVTSRSNNDKLNSAVLFSLQLHTPGYNQTLTLSSVNTTSIPETAPSQISASLSTTGDSEVYVTLQCISCYYK